MKDSRQTDRQLEPIKPSDASYHKPKTHEPYFHEADDKSPGHHTTKRSKAVRWRTFPMLKVERVLRDEQPLLLKENALNCIGATTYSDSTCSP